MTSPLAIHTDIAIAAPPALVWGILTDFTSYPAWNAYVIRIEGRAVAGETLRVTTPDITQSVRVVAADPYIMHWVGEAGTPGTFHGDHVFALTPTPAGGTELRHQEHFSGTAAAAILDAYGAALRANFERFNACLRDEAERQASRHGA